MGYFKYLTDQFFGTSPSGERFFLPYGVLFKAYIIPDTVTEQRLYQKQQRMLQVIIGLSLAFFLFTLCSDHMNNGELFFYIILLSILCWVMDRVFLAPELRNLKCLETGVPLQTSCLWPAQKYSAVHLLLLTIGSFMLMSIFTWALIVGIKVYGIFEIFFIAVCVLVFAFTAAMWGYGLYLKIRGRENTS